jgi:hypothetical protein
VEEPYVVVLLVGCVGGNDENADPVVAPFGPSGTFGKPGMPDLVSGPPLFPNENEEAMLDISVPP